MKSVIHKKKRMDLLDGNKKGGRILIKINNDKNANIDSNLKMWKFKTQLQSQKSEKKK